MAASSPSSSVGWSTSTPTKTRSTKSSPCITTWSNSMHVRAKHSSLQSHKVRHSEGPVSRGRRTGLEPVALWPAGSTRSIASQYHTAYHYGFMLTSRYHQSKSRKFVHVALLAIATALCLGPRLVHAQQSTEILPLSQVRAGM